MQQQQQQQQPQQQPPQNTQVLYGIPLDGIDEETRKQVERVMRVAVTILCVYFIGLIIDWLTGSISFFALVVGFVIASLIPMCGYYGAKDRNLTFLNFFTASNACCACFQVISLLGAYGTLGALEQHCKDCAKKLPDDRVNTTMGYSCDSYSKDSDCDTTGSFIWVTISCIVMFTLYAYACQLSQKLSNRPVFVQHINRTSNVNTVGMHQQPGTVVQARVVSVGVPMQAQQVTYQPNTGPTVVSGQPVVYQPNSSQPQMVVSQPRAGPSAIYQTHASIPNQQIKL
jgi:hypothetical protein